MKKNFRFLILALALCMLLPLLAACGGDGNGEDTTEQGAGDLNLTAEQLFWREVLQDAASYRIIRPTAAGIYDSRMALVLQTGIQSLSKGQVRVYEDTMMARQEKEIILGETTRAGEAYQSTFDVATLADNAFAIEYFGQTAVIHYGGFEGLVNAIRTIFGFIAEPSGKDANSLFDSVIENVQVYPGNVTLNNIYCDAMLFQQKKPAVLQGRGSEGFTVVARLLDSKGAEVTRKQADVTADGTWKISLDAPAGSYEKYSIKLSVLGIDVKTLSDVVFGELWIATGQSNMAYTLLKDIEFQNLRFDDEYIRTLRVGTRSSGNGGYSYDKLGDNENSSVKWFLGNDAASMEQMSAVAYYYASVLREELDMPVGVIQYAVGGTPIRSWLSRETIDSDPELKAHYEAKGYLPSREAWDNTAYRQACALYNTMGSVVDDLSIAGLIWYQGEQDAGEDAGDDNNGVKSYYLTEMELFYRQFCEMYGFENYDMPFLYSLMVPYRTSAQPTFFGEFTANMAKFAEKHKMASAIAIYDQDPYFNSDNNASHPNTKRLVGERMATAALSSTYGQSNPSTSPYPVDWKAENGSIVVTFENVADGLMIHNGMGNDGYLRGFTIAGSNGIYVMANAEIISKNQVKVWSPLVSEPVSVTYAYELLQRSCNLGCGKDGKVMYMAVPFCLNETDNAKHASYFLWMTCDFETQWRMSHSSKHHGFDYDCWSDCSPLNGSAIKISYDKTNAYSGTSALRVEHTGSGSFGVSPTSNGKGYDEGVVTTFKDAFQDFSSFKQLSFYVRNDGTSAVTFEGANFKLLTAHIAAGSDCADGVIPADGQWHQIKIDLTRFTDFVGNELGSESMQTVTKIQFMFNGTANGVILLDQFELLF